MRKITVISMMSLDGVMQAPGGPEEDTTGQFKYGGWTASYSDEAFNHILQRQMEPVDLLIGRKTYEIFASYWPHHEDSWPGINEAKKYVVSNWYANTKPDYLQWNNSEYVKSLADIQALKETDGPDLKVWGSRKLVNMLLRHDMVDELWLSIFPLTLGNGKKLFAGGAIPAAFSLVEHTVTSKGVIVTRYERAGEIVTGTVGE